MPVNRELWIGEFSAKGHPGWPCPKCGTGSLRCKNTTLAKADTAGSYLNEREGQIDTYKARFVCLFECMDSECGEPVAVSGSVHVVELPNYSYEDRFVAEAFIPAPQMIRIPASCPSTIQEEVRRAFTLYWLDKAAALNRIRNAIELLLTEMGVKRHGQKKGGGRSRLPLDARIQVLESSNPSLTDLCARLRAVKHLGNAGSHPGDVEREDVFDGFDILEDILLERYEKPQGRLAKMGREINRRKKPRGSKG